MRTLMSEPLSREEAAVIIKTALDVVNAQRRLRLCAPQNQERRWQALLSAEGRALKLLAKLSQPQSHGSPQE
jgi:hypothetical protein